MHEYRADKNNRWFFPEKWLMHDSVPVAAGRGVDRLAEGVRLVEEVVVEPQPGQAGVGHVAVADRVRGKRLFDGQRL